MGEGPEPLAFYSWFGGGEDLGEVSSTFLNPGKLAPRPLRSKGARDWFELVVSYFVIFHLVSDGTKTATKNFRDKVRFKVLNLRVWVTAASIQGVYVDI